MRKFIESGVITGGKARAILSVAFVFSLLFGAAFRQSNTAKVSAQSPDNEIVASPQSNPTTFSNHSLINIPDSGNASPYPSIINVNAQGTRLIKVTVTIRALRNGRADDLDIYLLAPDGRGTVLMSDAGGTGFNDQTFLTFDQASTNVIGDNGPLPGGTGNTVVSPGDKLVPADFDGDGKTDVAVYRLGTWYVQRSTMGFTNLQFGAADDVPVPADFDDDGKADYAVYRPSNGTWFVQRSTLGSLGFQFGVPGDKPVAADFDGDLQADFAVFRPSSGIWYVQQSTAGFTGLQFGSADDKLVVADYDGDGKADYAVYRPSNGFWYLQRSQLGFTGVQFGIATDLPVPADYDGDGKTDIGVYRTDTWLLQRSTSGFTGVQFGSSGDQPAPNAFVP